MSEVRTWVLAYLLNSVWQVPLLFGVGWVMAQITRRSGAAAEHRVWVGVLLGQAVMPACSVDSWRWMHGLTWWRQVHEGQARVSVVMGAGRVVNDSPLRGEVLAVVAIVYGLSVTYFAARLLWRSWRVAGMRRGARTMELEGAAARCWERCCKRFAVQDAVLAESAEVCGPVAMGLRHPLVLLPVGMRDGLAEEDLETVLAHECAHLRRRDFAKNLAYEVLRLPVTYHPFAWMTRSRVTESREVVCDAAAADAIAGRERYARSLLRLASLRLRERTVEVSHAIGIFDANAFERRVMRLTEGQRQMGAVQRGLIFAACVALGLGTCASALGMRIDLGETSAPVAGAERTGPVKVSAGVMAGQAQAKVVPTYPQEAKDKKISGIVMLHAVIGKEGAVENLQVISGPEVFRRSALDAVKSWTYKPYLLNGNPVEVETTITVNYSLVN